MTGPGSDGDDGEESRNSNLSVEGRARATG